MSLANGERVDVNLMMQAPPCQDATQVRSTGAGNHDSRTLLTMTAEADLQEPDSRRSGPVRQSRSERLLSILAPFRRVVVVSHVNPDPDSLASMLGLKALVESSLQGKSVTLT